MSEQSKEPDKAEYKMYAVKKGTQFLAYSEHRLNGFYWTNDFLGPEVWGSKGMKELHSKKHGGEVVEAIFSL